MASINDALFFYVFNNYTSSNPFCVSLFSNEFMKSYNRII